MTLRTILAAYAALTLGGVSAQDSRTIRTAAEVQKLVHEDYLAGLPFEITGTLVCDNGRRLIIDDGTGRTAIAYQWTNEVPATIRAGDIVSTRGRITYHQELYEWLRLEQIEITGHREPPPIISARLGDIAAGKWHNHVVRTSGAVACAFLDDIDDKWCYLVLKDGAESSYVTIWNTAANRSWAQGMVGAQVEVTGLSCNEAGLRRFFGSHINVDNIDDMRVLSPAPADPLAVPELEANTMGASKVASLGRRKVTGRILATWCGKNALLATDDRRVLQLRLAMGGVLPKHGVRITAVGMPETNLFRVNLSEAEIFTAPDDKPMIDEPAPISGERFRSAMTNPRNRVIFCGRTVKLSGVVRQVSQADDDIAVALEVLHEPITVYAAAARTKAETLTPGCRVTVTGTYLNETPSWHPEAPFPAMGGHVLALRNAGDLQIVSRPPWWTPTRLLVVIGLLIAGLAAIFVWNRALNRLVARRGRELMREQLTAVSARLKVDERTRLAAELHDALSQNLSGIACQLSVARLTLEGTSETRAILDAADQMLQSCRSELTRCIWDLRGDALEERDFSAAILKTLAPLALDATIHMRFNIPRARVSDSTAHAILCIVRELATNSVRHGKARNVRIAGDMHDGVISFSVRDDGCGFDPAAAQGVAEGHFGLEGIRERIRRLNGSFELISQPGHGTNARTTLK